MEFVCAKYKIKTLCKMSILDKSSSRIPRRFFKNMYLLNSVAEESGRGLNPRHDHIENFSLKARHKINKSFSPQSDEKSQLLGKDCAVGFIIRLICFIL
jgi:hypothetical protein